MNSAGVESHKTEGEITGEEAKGRQGSQLRMEKTMAFYRKFKASPQAGRDTP